MFAFASKGGEGKECRRIHHAWGGFIFWPNEAMNGRMSWEEDVSVA
jgi:hypothetical protein